MHRATELVCTFFSNFMPKAFTPKVIKNLYATPPSLFVPSAPQWHCVYLRPLRNSVCPLYKPFNLSSIFRKNLLLPYYHVLNTLLPCLLLLCLMSPITLSHVFHYSVTMSPITLLPCLPLPCLMSSITLLPCLPLPCYHVSHYPVSIKECKTTKKELTS